MNKEGVLLVNKSKGKTSFSLVSAIRKKTGIKKVGHCGTLDPFAEGVMIMLIGKSFTRKFQNYLDCDKEYEAEITFGKTTETYDSEATIQDFDSPEIPSLKELQTMLDKKFQGIIPQIPPMFSAKKIKGQKLYNLARKGISIDRSPVNVTVHTTLLSYSYPILNLKIICSKGTYIRSIAHDLGQLLKCGGYLSKLTRTRIGAFHLKDCINQENLYKQEFDPSPFIQNFQSC